MQSHVNQQELSDLANMKKDSQRSPESNATTSTQSQKIKHNGIKKIKKSNMMTKKTGLFSFRHFYYSVSLIRLVNSIKEWTLTIGDLKPISGDNVCEKYDKLFTDSYYKFKSKYSGKKRLLAYSMICLFKRDIIVNLFWQTIFIAAKIVLVYYTALTLISVRSPLQTLGHSYKTAAGMFVCSLLAFFALHQYSFISTYVANKMKVGILSMVCRKITKLSLFSIHALSIEKFMLIISSDTLALERWTSLVTLALAPFVFGGCVGLLWHYWGVRCLPGIGYLLFVGIIQKVSYDTTFKSKIGKGLGAQNRTKLTTEVLENIRLIKIYGWEFHYEGLIRDIRDGEIKAMNKIFLVDSFARAFLTSSSLISALLIYVTSTQTGGAPIASKIFPTVLLLTFIRQICILQTFGALNFILELKGIFGRIMSIMDLPEITPAGPTIQPLNPENSVEFENFTAYWVTKDITKEDIAQKNNKTASTTEMKDLLSEDEHPALSNINLNIKKGSLVAIIGKIASGKSSLLLALSDEMAKSVGEVRIEGRYAYLPQQPLIVSGTIKDAITFGASYDEDLFWKVLDAVFLAEDVKRLPKKELTTIANTGINLSGGRKTQIALARILYRQPDIVLLDDPLSNLDHKTAHKIFHSVIREYLKDVTVLLVTHRIAYSRFADQVILMDSGKIAAQGTYEDLTNDKVRFSSLFNIKEQDEMELLETEVYTKADDKQNNMKNDDHFNIVIEDEEAPKDEDEQLLAPTEKDQGLFISHERLDDAKVTFKVYFQYLFNRSYWYFIVVAIAFFVGTDYFSWLFQQLLGQWSRGQRSTKSAYVALSLLAGSHLVVNCVKYLLYFRSMIHSSKYLHNKMLKSVMSSPIVFFDKNPIGRILNRFTTDISYLDKFMIQVLLEFLEAFTLFMVSLVGLWANQPWILVPAGVAFILYLIIYKWCRKAVNQTRILELQTRSPLESLALICCNEIITIRARKQTETFIKLFYQKVYDNSRATTAYMTSARFMSFLIDLITELTVIVTLCITIQQPNSPLVRGVFLNFLISLPTTMQVILRSYIPLRLMMSNSARVINYCQNAKCVDLEKKTDYIFQNSGWPQRGQIDINKATLQYDKDAEPSIKNLSLTILPTEKIGVIGGMSGGVSSLTHMLLRTFNISPGEDSYVKIDFIETRGLGLHIIRHAMAVAPQNPDIFTGTIKETLDPLKEYGEEELWKALDTVELKEYVNSLKEKLDTYIHKGSSVFSLGQQQLLCLARALLKSKSKILIQDQATSHVDLSTDEIIQNRIESLYKDSVVLTITYRVWTISQYDKVLVLDRGRRIEFDEPYRLLVKEIGDPFITNLDGHFAKMVLRSGPKVSNWIFWLAMRKYYKKHDMTIPKRISHVQDKLNRKELKAEKPEEVKNLVAKKSNSEVNKRDSITKAASFNQIPELRNESSSSINTIDTPLINDNITDVMMHDLAPTHLKTLKSQPEALNDKRTDSSKKN